MDDTTTTDEGGSTDILGGINSLLTAGAQAYKTIEGARVTEKAAATAAANPNKTLTQTTADAPWYKAAWVMPAAIVGGIVILFSALRRR